MGKSQGQRKPCRENPTGYSPRVAKSPMRLSVSRKALCRCSSRPASVWADRPTPAGPCGTSPPLDLKVQGLLPGSWAKPGADTLLFSGSVVSDSATPWTATCQASLSCPSFQGLPTFTSTESVMPSSDLIGAHETQEHQGWRPQQGALWGQRV